MIRSTLAVMAAVVAVCAQAEAAVYTSSQTLNFAVSDSDTLIVNAFVPLFDTTRGSLNGLTFTLNGSASETVSFYQNTPPSSGVFQNTVQFFRDAPIVISTTPFGPGSFTSPTTFGETFAVNVTSAGYPTSIVSPGDRSIAVGLIVDGIPQPTLCCAYTSVRFQGTITTAYDYTPVPEPISLALLSAPVVALGLIRRRG